MTTFAWVAVAEQIRHDIHHGRTGPNGELDTEAEMGQRFGTSRITIRKALAELRAEGLVVSQRGSGSRAVLSSWVPVSVVIGAGQTAPNDLTVNRTEVRWRTLRPTGDLVAALRGAGQSQTPQGPGFASRMFSAQTEQCSMKRACGLHLKSYPTCRVKLWQWVRPHS
jgi:DNA-binding transcriptional MocR family regulator